METTSYLTSLEGVIERITYSNDENGYTIARLQPAEERELVTIVGNLPTLNVGESLRLQGRWTNHPRFGRQFQVEHYQLLLPATVEGIRRYLGSGLIKGIGPVTAGRIVDRFGLETLEVIEKAPARLIEVPGLGNKRAEMITQAWEAQKVIQEVMVFLQSLQINASLAVRIYKHYGDASPSIVQKEPYRMAREVFGIGFLTADKIARSVGIPQDSMERAMAGLLHVLSEASDDGHTYLPRPELVEKSAEMLEAPAERVETAIDRLIAERAVWSEITPDHEAVYLLPLHYAELGVANRVKGLLSHPIDRLRVFQGVDFENAFGFLKERDGVELTERQQEAVISALTRKVTAITGNPGTGKTTCIRSLIRLAETKKMAVVLAAPTGRAAKRLSEATDRPAKTIHRLLELRPGGDARYKQEEPLPADLVIVDETSMMDVLLTNALFKAVSPEAHLVLVGDVDQLPSVGPGNVLRDIIDSGAVSVVRLDAIFRQAQESSIIVNAHRINAGEMPVFDRGYGESFLVQEEDPEKVFEIIVDLVSQRIPRKFGHHPVHGIQVLSPMHRGKAGVAFLNEQLQQHLNPPSPDKAEKRFGGKLFRVGDKVMQIRNNYEKEVFNGDSGRVAAIDQEEQTVMVAFDDDRLVGYDFSELDELVHAYAISVHKAQGAEYPAVVIPILTQHYLLLQRNLVYTALTRAKKLVVLVGTKKALAIAIKNNKIAARYSGLKRKLSEGY
ncbi:MAG: ATP-dependent RecD-like DNA helicase [Chloroflexi bacterium]|nr:ATP-dependent RecD-like DNA helicase [Chloroflexota bacterium]